MRTHPLEVVQVRTDKVFQHPDNANMGDVDLIEESIEVNGFYKPLIVQRSTGYILVGNHTYLAAYGMGADTIPVIYLDIDDEAAKRLMIADNATNRAGHDDEGLLADVLLDLRESELRLRGTGYGEEVLSRLLADQEEPLRYETEEPELRVKDEEKPSKIGFRVSVTPLGDPPYEIVVEREGNGPFTQKDYQRIRIALGAGRATKEDIKAFDIAAWR